MNKQKLYWSCQIIGWSAYALVNIFSLKINNALTQNALWSFSFHALFFLFSTHIFRIFIIHQGWLRYVINKLIVRLIIAVIILGAVNFLFQVMVSFFLEGEFFGERLTPSLVIVNLATMPLIYFIWASGYFTYHYIESYNRSLKYEAAMTEIELSHLKSQLNPHFIFNALNSIKALVDEEPKKAKLAINQLSRILRNSLIADKLQLTPFENELKTVNDYLNLESVRYEERLNTCIRIDEQANKFKVPPLMLQTLVENGIKHGISTLRDGGKLNIDANVIDNELHIAIRNSGHFKGNRQKGLGLENTRQRLKLIYGDKARFSIQNDADEMVLTELIIPKKDTI